MKLNKNVNTGYTEPSININERYRTLARPGSEVSTESVLTPVGSPHPGARPDNTASTNPDGEPINVNPAETSATQEQVTNVNASKLESQDGVPNPNEVENDRITRTARYYFQPQYNYDPN